jgi:hypothetical protein
MHCLRGEEFMISRCQNLSLTGCQVDSMPVWKRGGVLESPCVCAPR